MQNSAWVVFLSAALVLPTLAEAASFCEKYADDIRALAGEVTLSLNPVMSVPSGALDTRPRREVGCEAQSQPPSGRIVLFVILRPEAGEQSQLQIESERYAKRKSSQTPEPSLGPEGFSLLETFPPDPRGPNSLLVLGHTESTVVRLQVWKRGTLAQRELTNVDVERGRLLVRKALRDFP